MEELTLPDELISYIATRFVADRSIEGIPAVIGISYAAVEKVLDLFVAWSAANGHLKDGVLTIGGLEAE